MVADDVWRWRTGTGGNLTNRRDLNALREVFQTIPDVELGRGVDIMKVFEAIVLGRE